MPSHFGLLEVTRKMPGADVGGLLRSGVASLCLAAGVLHVSAAADHRGMAGHVAFFLVVAVAQSALGAAILLARPGRWLAAGAVVNLAVALVWVLSRTTGLPVDGSSEPEAIGIKDGIATMVEIGAAAGAGLWWLLPDGARRVALPSGRLAAALLGTGVWAVGAAGLFAGHTHSPGHTHAAQAAHAPAAPNGAEHPHSGDPGHHDDHARRAADDAVAAGSGAGNHTHADASHDTAHDPADHHPAPEARPTAITTSAAGAHGHGSSLHHSEAQPVPNRAAGHHHDDVAAGPAQDGSGHEGEGHDRRHNGSAGGDHRRSGDDHDHNHDKGGSGNDKGDEDGGASPLEDVLKMIRPR
jgi:hypothetical protein